jgi:uncharacterized protein (TIGR03435 family)
MPRIGSCALTFAVAVVTTAYAQESARLEFDVASIKRASAEFGARSGFIPTPGRFVAENVSAQSLVGFAFRDTADEVKGASDWARSDRYNVTATLPRKATVSETALMLRNLLVDRFRLVAHIESEERNVLALLRVDPTRPLAQGLRRIDEDCTQPRDQPGSPPPLRQIETAEMPACLSVNNGRILNSGGMPMKMLAAQATSLVGRKVIDQTGLSGSYRFVLRYSRPEPNAPPATDDYPDITTALREQLGLKLVPTKAPVNVVVVDRLKPPSEN